MIGRPLIDYQTMSSSKRGAGQWPARFYGALLEILRLIEILAQQAGTIEADGVSLIDRLSDGA